MRRSIVCAVMVMGLAVSAMAKQDAQTQQRIDRKAGSLFGGLRVDDAEKEARLKAILGEYLVQMWAWREANEAQLAELWSEWNRRRAVVPKDEFPAELIAVQIEELYGALQPAYEKFIEQLATELTDAQIDAVKERWSRSPGMKRTYDAYLEIVPDLTDEQKQVIYNRMLMAREAAMLTDSDREIVNIYKRHKVKVEAYVGTLEWAKLHRAFANRGRTPPPTTAPAE